MQFGMCIGLQTTGPVQLLHLEDAKKAGADYVELPLASLMTLDESTFKEAVMKPVSDAGIPVYSLNVFFPGSLRLTGENADHAAALEYAKSALAHAEALGVKRVVLGSGGARNVPGDFPLAKGLDQMRDFLKQLGPIAEAHGLQIVIEPLQRGESNIINTLTEAADLAREVNHPAIAALVDYYHMRLIDESNDGILKAGNFLQHTHLARPLGRSMPVYATEDPYIDFFRALKKANYKGGLSLEGSVPEPYFESIQHAFKLLREIWAQA